MENSKFKLWPVIKYWFSNDLKFYLLFGILSIILLYLLFNKIPGGQKYFADYVDPFLAFSATIVALGISVVLARQKWEEKLPVELIVHFTYQKDKSSSKKYIYSCYGVNLLEGTDVRALSQQIGFQMNDNSKLSFNPSMKKINDQITQVIDENNKKKWIKYIEIEVLLDKEDVLRKNKGYYKVWNINHDKKEIKFFNNNRVPFHYFEGAPSIEELLSYNEESLKKFKDYTLHAIKPKKNKLYITNSPILPSEGKYTYKHIDIETAKKLLDEHSAGYISAVGHQSTANILSSLLKNKVAYNRILINMEPGDKAIVFKLKKRLEEGKIYTEKEIEDIGYELGLLEKLENAG